MKINPVYLVVLFAVIIFAGIETYFSFNKFTPKTISNFPSTISTTTGSLESKPKSIVISKTNIVKPAPSPSIYATFAAGTKLTADGLLTKQVGSTTSDQNIQKQYEFQISESNKGNVKGVVVISCDSSNTQCSSIDSSGIGNKYVIEATFDSSRNWFLVQKVHLFTGDQ